MLTDAIKELLRESSLFKDLTDQEMDKIARFSRMATFESGDVLFHEGEPSEEIYLVANGTVAVEVGLLGRQRRRRATIETVRRGQCVGWSAGVGSAKYMGTANVVEPTTVVTINGKAIRSLFEEDPSLGLRVMRKLVELARSRLTHTTERLANILSVASHDLKAPAGRSTKLPPGDPGRLCRRNDRATKKYAAQKRGEDQATVVDDRRHPGYVPPRAA